jgi:hypothetical protein
MPRLLLAPRRVEARAREEGGLDGVLAAIAQRPEFRLLLVRSLAGAFRGGCGSTGAAEFLVELLEHAHRLSAAGLAKVQALFALEEDGIGVVRAVVAALAAILLRHGGHQLLRLGLVLGEVHAVGDRHRRVVPGRVVVVGEPGTGGRSLARREGGRPLDGGAEQRGEVARQPGALVGAEGGALGD